MHMEAGKRGSLCFGSQCRVERRGEPRCEVQRRSGRGSRSFRASTSRALLIFLLLDGWVAGCWSRSTDRCTMKGSPSSSDNTCKIVEDIPPGSLATP